jgi:hypothetical protein
MHAREHEVVVNAVVQVGATRDDEIARPACELFARDVDGGERRRARRVDRVIDPSEIEPVGDASCDDVGKDARK